MNGEIHRFIYTAAVYAGDDQREFTAFDAGVVYQAGLGYNLKEITGWDKAIVKLDYQYSDDAANAGGGASFEHSMSLNSTWEKGRFLMYTDLLGGTGRGNQGDVIGFHVIPAYFLTEDLQVVFRYQYAHGDNDGIRLQSRYERLASDLTDGGRGEDYHAAYLGLNYYLYSHKLKVMAGVEYHNMDGGGDGGDFDGWTGLVGVRMYF